MPLTLWLEKSTKEYSDIEIAILIAQWENIFRQILLWHFETDNTLVTKDEMSFTKIWIRWLLQGRSNMDKVTNQRNCCFFPAVWISMRRLLVSPRNIIACERETTHQSRLISIADWVSIVMQRTNLWSFSQRRGSKENPFLIHVYIFTYIWIYIESHIGRYQVIRNSPF